MDALVSCEENIFLNIFELLKMLAILPVLSATVEKRLSSLWRLKTYHKSTKSETRLNGLPLLFIHWGITFR